MHYMLKIMLLSSAFFCVCVYCLLLLSRFKKLTKMEKNIYDVMYLEGPCIIVYFSWLFC